MHLEHSPDKHQDHDNVQRGLSDLVYMFLGRTGNSLDIHRRDQSPVHLFDEVELLGHIGPIVKYSVLTIHASREE